MELRSPFVIRDLPDDSWSVSWPGYEYHVVNTPDKGQKLLDILFEQVKVDKACLAVIFTHNNTSRHQIMEIDFAAWANKNSMIGCHLDGFLVEAVKVNTVQQAETFKSILEQMYVWRKLGGIWK